MNHARRAGLLFAFALVMLLSPLVSASEIWTPRLHNPAFAEPGKTFVAEVRAPATHAANGWSATIQNDLKTWNCTVTAALGRIHHQLEDGWILTIRVPADASPELCGLTIRHNAGDTMTSIRAVQVVRNFEESFYILHLSDVHIADPIARQASGETAKSGNGSTDAMKWAAPIINLINPRFVMYTGDNFHAYYEANSWGGLDLSTNRLHWFQDGLNAHTVATAITSGNHDLGYQSYIFSREWRAQYEREMGQRNFSWRMGSFYVMSQEFNYDQYLAWARADYAAAYADPTIKYRLVGMHYPDLWTNPCNATNPCNLLIAGHSHSTSKLQTTPFPIVTVGTALDRQRSAFYNFQKTSAGWECPQVATHGEGNNVFRLVGDWGAPTMTSTYAVPNDGTRDSNTATIRNNLNQDFYNGRVRFLLPKGTYAVSGGSIESMYDYNNGSNTAVLAKVNILKNSTVTVSVVRTSAPPQTPAAPSSLSANATSASQINLSWSDNANNETGFKLERKTGSGGTWSQIATPGANTTSYSSTGLSASTQFFFRVRATNGAGDSGYSNEANATTQAPPAVAPIVTAQPANITVLAPSTANFAISASGTAPLAYQWQRQASGSTAWANVSNGSGGTSANYTTAATSVADNGAKYRCVVMNSAGSATSNAGTLTVTVLSVGTGSGLRGDYFDNADLTAFKLSRVDGTVDFDWGNAAPDASIGVDTFSVIWRGEVQAQISETYTFFTTSDDGVRLWVNGVKLVDNWTDHGPTEDSGTIALSAGQKYSIRMEFFENGGGAVARLAWSSLSTPKQIIPKSQLYPAAVNRAPALLSSLSATPNPATTDETVAFAANASDADGDPITYSWDFGDGTFGTGASSTHKYGAPGTYAAAVTVADNRGGNTSGSVNVVVTAPALPQLSVKVNFQLAGAATPAGNLADTGAVFGNRGNGYSYGWNSDNSSTARDRNAANSPDQRYDTLLHLQKPENPNAVWEISLPNGQYTVRVVSGDPSYFDSVYNLNVEGVLTVNATPTATAKWFEGTRTVAVSDGRLTISNAAGAANNKICFVEISNGVVARDLAIDAPEARPLGVTKLLLSMSFAKLGRDSYRVAGTLGALEAGFEPNSRTASIDVGAAISNFTLDAKGRGKSKAGMLFLKKDAKKGWHFQASVSKGAWGEAWSDGGLTNATVTQPAEIPVTLTLGDQTFGGSKTLTYKAKQKKTGKGK